MNITALVVSANLAAQSISHAYSDCLSEAWSAQSALDDPGALYAAGAGSLYRWNGIAGTRQVLRPTAGSNAFKLGAASSQVIYASDYTGTPFTSPLGLYRSLDRGATWVPLAPTDACGLPIQAVSSHGRDLVIGGNGSCSLAQISHDFGQTWQPLNALVSSGDVVAFSNVDPAVVYVQNWLSVRRSTDGGATFHDMAMRGYRRDLGFTSFTGWTERDLLYTLSFGNSGVFFQYSRNGGDDWTQVTPISRMGTFFLSPNVPGRIYARGASGAQAIYMRSDDGGNAWIDIPVLANPFPTCNRTPTLRASASTAGVTLLYPEEALLILAVDEPPARVVVVPLAPWLPMLLFVALAAAGAAAIGRRRRAAGVRR